MTARRRATRTILDEAVQRVAEIVEANDRADLMRVLDVLALVARMAPNIEAYRAELVDALDEGDLLTKVASEIEARSRLDSMPVIGGMQ